MQLTLPEAVETTLSPRKAALHLAIGLFVSEEATLGQAVEIAGLTQAAFLKELGARHISIHYGMDELAEDLKVIFPNRSTTAKRKPKCLDWLDDYPLSPVAARDTKAALKKNVTVTHQYPHSTTPVARR